MFIIVKALAAAGWRCGPEPAIHDADSPRFFGTDRFVDRRACLQCLLSWDELAARGLAQLWSGQKPAYYLCMLGCAIPADVLPNLPVAAYRAAEMQPGRLAVSVALALADGDGQSDAESQVQPHAHGRARARRADAPPCRVDGGLASAAAVAPAGSLGSGSNSSSGSSSDSTSNSPAKDSGTDTCGMPFTPRTLAARPDYLVPADMVLDRFQGRGQGYFRLKLRCPLHAGEHWDAGKVCQKYRSIGPTTTARWGAGEPEAFLRAWAALGQSLPDRAGHCRAAPGVRQVDEQAPALSLVWTGIGPSVAEPVPGHR